MFMSGLENCGETEVAIKNPKSQTGCDLENIANLFVQPSLLEYGIPASTGAIWTTGTQRNSGEFFEGGGRGRLKPSKASFWDLGFGIWVLGFCLFARPVPGADLTPAQTQFFETKIRPVLVNNCYKCHSDQAEKVRGGLLLDSRDGLLKGGNTGPAIVPGDPEKSLLIKAIRYADPDLQMPPKDKKLSDEEI